MRTLTRTPHAPELARWRRRDSGSACSVMSGPMPRTHCDRSRYGEERRNSPDDRGAPLAIDPSLMHAMLVRSLEDPG